MQAFNVCHFFIPYTLQHWASARCDYTRETYILNHGVEAQGPQMMSLEAAEWGLDTALMWVDSGADTCNLRWAVLALLWLCFLWLRLKNSLCVTEDFHLMSHQMSEFWAQVWDWIHSLIQQDESSCCSGNLKQSWSPCDVLVNEETLRSVM